MHGNNILGIKISNISKAIDHLLVVLVWIVWKNNWLDWLYSVSKMLYYL